MRRSNIMTVIALVAVAVAAASVLSGCKGEAGIRKYLPGFLKRKPELVPPTEESFRLSAEQYFLDNGYEKTGDGRYRISDDETQGRRTHLLDWEPVRIIEYSHSTYHYQGIVRRKTITRVGDRDEIKESPFIMYWNAKGNRWEHLFGSDIPQSGD